VGNHSWSHQVITPEMVDREVRQAKEVLEEAIGGRVPLYCAPGDNTNMADHVLAACRACGYLGAMSLTDALNRPGDELFWLNRTALHDQFYGPFFSEFDPYRNIRHAERAHGWIIDYCHCPLEAPVHRNKDCSEAQLRRRFEAVLAEGGDAVWCANPDEVIDYHLTRRHTRVEADDERSGDGATGRRGETAEQRYRLRLDGLPSGVECRALTLEAEVPAAWCQRPVVWIGERLVAPSPDRPVAPSSLRPLCAELVRPQRLRVTVEVTDGMEIVFRGRDV
jgi:hypothetical protein